MENDLKAMSLSELLAEHRRLVELPVYQDFENEADYKAVITEIKRRELEYSRLTAND